MDILVLLREYHNMRTFCYRSDLGVQGVAFYIYGYGKALIVTIYAKDLLIQIKFKCIGVAFMSMENRKALEIIKYARDHFHSLYVASKTKHQMLC